MWKRCSPSQYSAPFAFSVVTAVCTVFLILQCWISWLRISLHLQQALEHQTMPFRCHSLFFNHYFSTLLSHQNFMYPLLISRSLSLLSYENDYDIDNDSSYWRDEVSVGIADTTSLLVCAWRAEVLCFSPCPTKPGMGVSSTWCGAWLLHPGYRPSSSLHLIYILHS